MPDPSKSEMRGLLVATTFQSEAFIVARGEKTPDMLSAEANNVASATAAKLASGSTAPLAKGFSSPNPHPANLAVLDKLAGALRYIVADDLQLAAETKIKFKEHFAGVLDPNGQVTLEPACDATWDAAKPEDVMYKTLRNLGLHRGCDPKGIDSLVKWVKSRTYGSLMPTGELADNILCLKKLLLWDEALIGGKLEWNEMDCCITLDRVRVQDNVTSMDIRIAMGEQYFVPNNGRRGMRSFCPSDTNVLQVMESLARANKYHEAREYLEKLGPTWDKTSRMAQLVKYLGGIKVIKPGHTKTEADWITKCNALYVSQFTKTMIGIVARTFKPGCQMDTMLVLKSKQGTKKSSFFEAWAPARKFTSAHVDFGTKDSRMMFMQNTVIEIAELSGFQKKDTQLVKAEITTRSDDFRLPYGKATTRNPRWCVFVGSTNDDKFLRDPTGSRRFWIIPIDEDQSVDLQHIIPLLEQAWAEAVTLYLGAKGCPVCEEASDGEVRCPGHRWWLSKEEDELREQINQEYTEEEPLIEWLKSWIANNVSDKNSTKQGLHASHKNTDALKVYELLQAAQFTPKECHERAIQNRMIVALKACGYVREHTKYGNVWISPGMQGRPVLSVVRGDEEPLDTGKQEPEEKTVTDAEKKESV